MTFPAGVTSVSFNITIINDNVLEYNETFSLFITEELLPENVLLGEFNTTEVTIVSDGTTGEYALILIVNAGKYIGRLHSWYVKHFKIFNQKTWLYKRSTQETKKA